MALFNVLLIQLPLLDPAPMVQWVASWSPAYFSSPGEAFLGVVLSSLPAAAILGSFRIIPQVSMNSSPEELERVNQQLRSEIAARIKAEEQLKQLLKKERSAVEERLLSLFEAAPQAILAINPDGKLVLVNRKTEAMFGYMREQLLGQPLAMLLPERSRKIHAAHREKYFSDPRQREMGQGSSLWGRRKDGSEFPVEVGLSHVETSEGPWAMGLVADITARRQAEHELEMVNYEIRESYQKLEQFTYIVAHDLQEPLRTIANYLQLLNRQCGDQLTERAVEYLQYAINGAVRMKGLLDGLMRLSHAGTKQLELERVSCSLLVNEAIENLKKRIEEKEARITVDPLPQVHVDPNLMVQVFQNLISNALKFHAPDDKPNIKIRADWESGWLKILVSDNGIGIEPHHMKRVFEVFEQLNGRNYPGSGIGLALVKRIVERHGGSIEVSSTPGKGSLFSLRIPA